MRNCLNGCGPGQPCQWARPRHRRPAWSCATLPWKSRRHRQEDGNRRQNYEDFAKHDATSLQKLACRHRFAAPHLGECGTSAQKRRAFRKFRGRILKFRGRFFGFRGRIQGECRKCAVHFGTACARQPATHGGKRLNVCLLHGLGNRKRPQAERKKITKRKKFSPTVLHYCPKISVLSNSSKICPHGIPRYCGKNRNFACKMG